MESIRGLKRKLNEQIQEMKNISKKLDFLKTELDDINENSELFSIHFIKIDKDAICPKKNTEYDAGYDLFCINDFEIESHSTQCISIGIKIDFKQIYGYVFKIESRSSLAKEGITVEGGIIDISYKGEIKVILHNNQNKKFSFKKGSKIAQMCLYKISNNLTFIEKEDIKFKSERDIKGFGSSGN